MQAADFPTYLRKAMAAARIDSASDLARASGIGEAQISRWLRGQNQPDLANLRRLSRHLGRPLLELLVAAGHLEPREAAMKDQPDPPELIRMDVISAIREDPQLAVEAKAHLEHQYELLLRLAPSAPADRKAPRLRVARKRTTERGEDRDG